MKARLLRFDSNDERTLGVLIVGGVVCFTLELPWRDNARNVSCIARGMYTLKPWTSPRHGKCLKVSGCEPQRTHILIHAGNVTDDIKGCIAPGMRCGANSVYQSRNAMKLLLKRVTAPIPLEIS